MKKLIFNYHTHTSFCGHAKIEDNENYVKEAIKNNYETLGFSDHAPFKNIYHENMRMNFELFPFYLDMINEFKEKYKNKIKIYNGLEIEYYKEIDDYYLSLFKDYHIDYLILGQHCYYENGNVKFYYKGNNDIEGIKKYAKDLINGMNTHYFSYVCHPDIFMNKVTIWNEDIIEISKEIINAALKNNLPLEININGFVCRVIYNSDYYKYPNINFFKLAKKMGAKFIFGVDAHESARLNHSNIPYKELEEFLKECNINDDDFISNLKLVNPCK